MKQLHVERGRTTSIDLSRASLGYAVRKAIEYGVDDKAEFVQGDLLRIADLGREFPIIESVGVLHHMEDPAAGLRALRGVLAPRGLMVLGLYSERARRDVVALRKRLAEDGYQPDRATMRACRHGLLHGDLLEQFPTFRGFSDWRTSISELRDLVFHVQERRFTPLGIKALLDAVGLEFLGFLNLKTPAIAAYEAEFPDDPWRTNLDHWEQFEERHPDTFRGMLQFVCQAL